MSTRLPGAAKIFLRLAPILLAPACAVTSRMAGPKPLPVDSQLAEGGRVYAVSCAACHLADGEGMEGLSLPLRNSKWVLGPEDRLIRIVLHGVRGPIDAAGVEANLEMPGMGFFSDEEIAAVLTYTRSAWGHRAPRVSAPSVARVRAETEGRGDSWTVAELEAVRLE